MRYFAFVFTTVLSLPLFASSAPATSNSERYRGLVEDNEAKMRFSDGQNDKLNRYLSRTSPNFASVRDSLHKLYSGATIRSTLKVDATHQLQWIDQGIDKASEVHLIDTTGTSPTVLLFSTFSKGIGISSAISALSLSPNGNYVMIAIADYGSIDQMSGIIIDINKNEEVATLDLYEATQAWLSPSTLQYARQEEDGSYKEAYFDVVTRHDSDAKTDLVGSSKDLTLLADYTAHTYSLVNNKTGTSTPIAFSAASGSLEGNDQSQAFFLSHAGGVSQISAVPWAGSAPLTLQTLVTEKKLYFDRLWVDEGGLFVQARAGAARWFRVYSPVTGRLLREVAVPDCCSLSNVTWLTRDQKIAVTFRGPAVASGQFILDLASGSWNKDPDANMLSHDGTNFKSEVFNSISVDGTSIPTRLIYRADLARDASHTVLIKSYGGFGLAGYIDPRFDRAALAFLKKGGMIAAPALRGGNEFGDEWHRQATLQNKIKTYEDLVAVARQLVKDRWTVAPKIALQGTSNGGLTTAATALLFPDDFGLAIPIAGVNDLLGKDVLDAENDGWSSEYGSVAAGASYLTAISPLENASRQGQVRFLIVDGADDTRVNPAHSIKLAKALVDQGGNSRNAFLLTLANGGHGVESIATQNSIALKMEIVTWTMLFDL